MRYGLFRMTATADPTVAKAREMEEELTRLAYIEDPEDPEFVEINPIAILQGLINVMDLQIGKVIRVKRALALAGVDPEELEEVLPQDYPEFSALIGGSSTSLSQALMPLLYLEFTALQEAGTVDQAWTEEDFYAECAPTRDFYANDRGEIVFFLPPMLLSAPSFDVPSLAFTPAQLEDILRAADADGPQ